MGVDLLPLNWKIFWRIMSACCNCAHCWVWVIFSNPPLSFPANRKKPNFGKMKSDKSVFSDISWPLTSFIFFFCAGYWNRLIALMKLFSLGRTDLAVSSKLPTPVGIAKCRRTIIVLRTSVMVWYTWRSPWTVVFAHCVQSSNETHSLPSCLFFSIVKYHRYKYSSSSEQIASKITEIHTHSINLMIFLLKVYKLRSVQIACEILPTFDTL